MVFIMHDNNSLNSREVRDETYMMLFFCSDGIFIDIFATSSLNVNFFLPIIASDYVMLSLKESNISKKYKKR